MANPRVRPHLHFYPEDAGKTVNEYWHARHWHEVADPSLVTPMAVVKNTHFFVYEPIILNNGLVVIPYRWFLHRGSITARAWPLRAVKHGNDVGWIVEEFKTVIVSQEALFMPLGSWGPGQLYPSLPSAKCIFGTFMPVMLIHSYLKSLKVPHWSQMVLLSRGHGLIQILGIDGALLLAGHVCIRSLFGFTATTFPGTNQKSGINIIRSYSQLQVYLVCSFSMNIMFTFSVPPTLPLRLR